MTARRAPAPVDRERSLRRAALVRWYRRQHRPLPWRETRDSYRVWVSEIMLQQTRVETVLRYYERFLERFPTVGALANAPLPEVLGLWSGLGYYRRARMLHAAAALVVERHGGVFPRTLAEAVALPGIGRSTAGAILSISYDIPAPVLDGNVQRVLCRWHGWRGTPGAGPLAARLWAEAGALVDCDGPGDVNQALMERGATVCLPAAAARCASCPVRARCAALRQETVAELPERARRTPPLPQTWAVALARRGERFLVRQRGPTGLLHGLIELPTVELDDASAADDDATRRALAAFLRAELGLVARVGDERLQHRHAISNRRVLERVFEVSVRGAAGRSARWLSEGALRVLPITTATRKILDRLD